MTGAGEFGPPIHFLPEKSRRTWLELAPRRTQFVACLNELEVFDENCRLLAEAATPLGDLPLTVLSSDRASFGLGQDFVDAWMELQSEIASRSTGQPAPRGRG